MALSDVPQTFQDRWDRIIVFVLRLATWLVFRFGIVLGLIVGTASPSKIGVRADICHIANCRCKARWIGCHWILETSGVRVCRWHWYTVSHRRKV